VAAVLVLAVLIVIRLPWDGGGWNATRQQTWRDTQVDSAD